MLLKWTDSLPQGNDGANCNLSEKVILLHRAPGTKRLPRCARNNQLIGIFLSFKIQNQGLWLTDLPLFAGL
ncbi:hypothetical protein C9994_09815 [Marivirga lumbricoides]|uniref:Uncharacterized protein n=1 Tax=Marivirga lumbricoides TaxID=1046115 RepID=A0A2T4DPZ0_9BACT|nr:hypothetical protein C9994_09815 [Marivirga lumbricoides]